MAIGKPDPQRQAQQRAAEDEGERDGCDEERLHGCLGALLAAPAPAEASGTIFAPKSLSRRWNSGDAMMIVPAAARRRSTASGGRTNDVGCSFRYARSFGSGNAANDTSMA